MSASCPLASIMHRQKPRKTTKPTKLTKPTQTRKTTAKIVTPPAAYWTKPKAKARPSKATLLQRAYEDGCQAFRDDRVQAGLSVNPYEEIDFDLTRAWNAGYGIARAAKITRNWQREMTSLLRKAA